MSRIPSILATAAAVLALAVPASANFTASEAHFIVKGVQVLGPESDPTGDSYTSVPGIGGTGGFAISGTYVDSSFDGLVDVIGTDAASSTIETTETLVDNGGGNFDMTLTQTAAMGADLFPGGFLVGGMPADQGGNFFGASAGGDPLDFVGGPAIVNSASFELFDAAGGSLGTGDISSFAVFTAGPGGSWEGSLGVVFGAGSAGGGINSAVYSINFTVPEPSSPALPSLAALLGLAVLRRRS